MSYIGKRIEKRVPGTITLPIGVREFSIEDDVDLVFECPYCGAINIFNSIDTDNLENKMMEVTNTNTSEMNCDECEKEITLTFKTTFSMKLTVTTFPKKV